MEQSFGSRAVLEGAEASAEPSNPAERSQAGPALKEHHSWCIFPVIHIGITRLLEYFFFLMRRRQNTLVAK